MPELSPSAAAAAYVLHVSSNLSSAMGERFLRETRRDSAVTAAAAFGSGRLEFAIECHAAPCFKAELSTG